MKSTIPAELQDDDLDDDTDGMPSDLEGDDSEEEGGEESEDDVSEDEHQDNGSDAISLPEASDAEDLLPLDADIPEGLVDYDGPDAGSGGDEEEEWGGISGSQTQPNKRKRGEEDKRKRKKLRSLPTFASYEDYAKLIEDGEEDNV